MSNRLWLAKLGPSNVLAYISWNNGIIGVGRSLKKSQLKEIQNYLPDKESANNKIEDFLDDSQERGTLQRFIVEAETGDFVLVGPIYWVAEGEENEKKRYIIGVLTSNVFIPEEDYEDEEYKGYFSLVREIKWKELNEKLPKGMRDYIGRNHQTFAFAKHSMLSYDEISKIFKGEDFDEYEKIDKNYETLSKSIIDYLSSMNANDFEDYIKDLLNENKWDVETTPRSGDKGVDVVGLAPLIGNIYSEVIVQVKSYKEPINKNLIINFQSKEIPLYYNLDNPVRVFITTSNFTNNARKQSKGEDSYPVILIDGRDLANLVIFSDMIPGIQWPIDEE
ncbi:hypothetical protein ES705_20324 [subsurface metagenome]